MYTKQNNLANNKIRWDCVWKKKKNIIDSITTDQMILNVLKNIEHKDHSPSPAQV